MASQAHAAEPEFFDDGPLSGRGLPFSESVRVGDLLFLSGQIGDAGDARPVAGGVRAEADQVLRNIEAALKRRGLEMSDVVKCTVFLADIAEWGEFNEVYKRYFSAPYPARSALAASGLAMDARVELECIAAYPPGAG
jgi:reactive intermediate/imine deaminase